MRQALDAIDFVRPYVRNMPDIASMIPAIVVVGDQSSGKSSLLEVLSGVTLPRGEGICTRVPLELQLRQASEWAAHIEYQINGDGPSRCQRIEIDGVKDAIMLATKCIAGTDLNVKDSPIVLRISGPSYQDLTLIDLPGILSKRAVLLRMYCVSIITRHFVSFARYCKGSTERTTKEHRRSNDGNDYEIYFRGFKSDFVCHSRKHRVRD